MAQFRIKIAGKTAQVHSLFESTRDYCRNYLAEDSPDLFIETCLEDLAFEQAAADAEALEEGFRRRVFTDPFLERASIQRKLAQELFDCGTLLFHGSAVCVDGAGYLFTARSGTGKSTHTRLWRKVFPERAVIVNDDKPFLRVTDGGVLVCGSPWSGKHGLDANITVPLRGICILRRGEENRIERIEPGDAMPMLLKQAIPPQDPGRLPRFRQLVEQLGEKTALWQMACTKDPQAARIAHAAMSEL